MSTTTPSESMTRYVGIAGRALGCSKDISEVNLLFTAPGKFILNQTVLEPVTRQRRITHRFEPGLWETEFHRMEIREALVGIKDRRPARAVESRRRED